jgi:hypothetical protein
LIGVDYVFHVRRSLPDGDGASGQRLQGDVAESAGELVGVAMTDGARAAERQSDRPARLDRRAVLALQAAVVLLWSAVIASGVFFALRYETTAAETRPAPGVAPADASAHVSAHMSADGPELVMFVHPRCPCSRASLTELERLLARCDGRLRCRVAFVRPASCAPGWERTDLWDRAARIPGVRAVVDHGGEEARRFAARASGEAFLVMPDGRIAFHGGLTPGRGHEGDNVGRASVEAILAGRTPLQTECPVFGCGLGVASRDRQADRRADRRADRQAVDAH